MRILHVNRYLHRRSYADAYAEDLAQLQHVAGHEVTFFGMRHPANRIYQYERSFPSHVEFDPDRAGPVDKVKGVGRATWSPSASHGMDDVLADFQPDVVHLHDVYGELSPSVLRPVAKRGIPAVMTLHDYTLACPTHELMDHGRPCTACITGGPMQAVRRRCGSSLARSAAAAIRTSLHRMTHAYAPVHRFLCPSWFLADVMRSANVFPYRLHVQEYFVDTDAIVPGHLPGEDAVYHGPLTADRGVDVLVRAWPRVPGGAHLHVVGDGPERATLEALAEELAPGRVTFHGELDTAKAHGLIRGAVCVVSPSVAHDSQASSVLEAFACGRPVVATKLGALPEVVDPGVDGELVAPGDPEALADAVASLLAAPDRAADMGDAARAKAERRFAPTAHADAIEHHYEDVRDRVRIGA